MKKDLKIIFIGTPDFAVESLKSIIEAGKNVVAVITAVDKKAGRGQKINESAVKKYALSQGLNVLQPSNLKNPYFIEELKALKADLQIVVAFRMLPEVVWNMPNYGTFNLHASLLPNYRGAAPINWAIINGEKETGVSTFFLKHKIDTGDIIYQEKMAIGDSETAGDLHDKLMVIGGELVVKTIEAIEQDNFKTIAQSTDESKEAPKLFKENCKIDWTKSSVEVNNLIRGLSPYPASWCIIEHIETGKKLNLKIYKSSIGKTSNDLDSGEIKVAGRSINIGTGNGSLCIDELQVEGKKRMLAKDLLNGFSINEYKIS